MMMHELDHDTTAVETTSPRTATVLIFLAASAVILSWVCTYAATNALIAADMMSPFPRDGDPRPQWMLNAFIGFFVTSTVVALIFRWLSRRQIKRIDAMAEAE